MLPLLVVTAGALLVAAPVDRHTLRQKLLFGYQGWFDNPSSGSRGEGAGGSWGHWCDGCGSRGVPNATNVHPDVFPDMREFPPSTLAPSGFHNRGTNAVIQLYTEFAHETQEVHFRWMEEYGIDGVFLQRFTSVSSCAPGRREQGGGCYYYDNITLSALGAAERHGRVLAMMYDISGCADPWARTAADWKHLVEDLKITKHPRYLHHDGRPVLSIWGFGFTDRTGNATSALTFIRALQAGGYFVIGGVPTYWRTSDGDSKSGWGEVYDALDVVSPWLSGRFRTVSEFNTGIPSTGSPAQRECPRGHCPGVPLFTADLQYIASRPKPLEYAPVLFPGFSWTNMHKNKTLKTPPAPRFAYPEGGIFNVVPRMGGRFWLNQAQWWTRNTSNATGMKSPLFLYGAMWDEIDEGTSMIKMAASEAETPLEGRFIHASIDGEQLPGDHYLQLAGNFTREWRGGGEAVTLPPVPSVMRALQQLAATGLS